LPGLKPATPIVLPEQNPAFMENRFIIHSFIHKFYNLSSIIWNVISSTNMESIMNKTGANGAWNQASGAVKKAAGEGLESLGKATGSAKIAAEGGKLDVKGTAQKVGGKVQSVIGSFKDGFKGDA